MTVTTPGEPEAIDATEVPVLVPGPHEVLIKVRAAGVNPVDEQTRSGIYHGLGWITISPVGLGWDVAGDIVDVGSDVRDFRFGDRVAGLSGGVDKRIGTYAEYIALPAAAVAIRPDMMPAEDAAGIPRVYLTATQALDLLGRGYGRTLLVTGAAGGVGGAAVRLATDRGFTVSGLARASDDAFVTAAGGSLITELPPDPVFDAVLDAAVLGDPALATVCDGGDYLSVVPPMAPASVRGVSVASVMVTPDGAALADLLVRVSSGDLPARVARIVPMREAVDAHRTLAAGGLRGRIILTT